MSEQLPDHQPALTRREILGTLTSVLGSSAIPVSAGTSVVAQIATIQAAATATVSAIGTVFPSYKSHLVRSLFQVKFGMNADDVNRGGLTDNVLLAHAQGEEARRTLMQKGASALFKKRDKEMHRQLCCCIESGTLDASTRTMLVNAGLASIGKKRSDLPRLSSEASADILFGNEPTEALLEIRQRLNLSEIIYRSGISVSSALEQVILDRQLSQSDVNEEFNECADSLRLDAWTWEAMEQGQQSLNLSNNNDTPLGYVPLFSALCDDAVLQSIKNCLSAVPECNSTSFMGRFTDEELTAIARQLGTPGTFLRKAFEEHLAYFFDNELNRWDAMAHLVANTDIPDRLIPDPIKARAEDNGRIAHALRQPGERIAGQIQTIIHQRLIEEVLHDESEEPKAL